MLFRISSLILFMKVEFLHLEGNATCFSVTLESSVEIIFSLIFPLQATAQSLALGWTLTVEHNPTMNWLEKNPAGIVPAAHTMSIAWGLSVTRKLPDTRHLDFANCHHCFLANMCTCIALLDYFNQHAKSDCSHWKIYTCSWTISSPEMWLSPPRKCPDFIPDRQSLPSSD